MDTFCVFSFCSVAKLRKGLVSQLHTSILPWLISELTDSHHGLSSRFEPLFLSAPPPHPRIWMDPSGAGTRTSIIWGISFSTCLLEPDQIYILGFCDRWHLGTKAMVLRKTFKNIAMFHFFIYLRCFWTLVKKRISHLRINNNSKLILCIYL